MAENLLTDEEFLALPSKRSAPRILTDEEFLSLSPRPALPDESPETTKTKFPRPDRPEDSWLETGRKLIENVGPQFRKSGGGLLQKFGEMLPEPPLGIPSDDPQWQGIERQFRARAESPGNPLAKMGREIYATAEAEIKENTPNIDPDSLKGYTYDIVSAMIQMAPTFAAAVITRKPAVGLATMGGQVYGQEYGEARAAGRTPEQASMDATFYALAETIPESIPLGIITKEGGKFLPRVLKGMGAEGVQEQGTEILRIAYETGVLDKNKDMTWGEAWDRIKRAGIVGAGMGGGMAAVTHPFVRERKPPGEREKTAVQPPPITPEDEASPIPTDLIAEGQKLLQDADAANKADEILTRNGFPGVDSRVSIASPDGRSVAGTVVDAFSVTEPEMDATAEGVKIALDDGTIFEEFFPAFQARGLTVSQMAEPTPQTEPSAKPAQARRLEQAAQPQAPATSLAVEPGAPAQPQRGPYFEEFRNLLPKDLAGDTDVTGVGAEIIRQVAGEKKSWNGLTLDQRVAAIERARALQRKESPDDTQRGIEVRRPLEEGQEPGQVPVAQAGPEAARAGGILQAPEAAGGLVERQPIARGPLTEAEREWYEASYRASKTTAPKNFAAPNVIAAYQIGFQDAVEGFPLADDRTNPEKIGYRNGVKWLADNPRLSVVVEPAPQKALKAKIAAKRQVMQQPAPETAADYDPLPYLEPAKRYIRETSKPLAPEAVGRALGITPAHARRVLSAVAAQKDSGLRQGKGGVLRRVARHGLLDIAQFIASKGGIRDQGGELKSRDWDKVFIPGFGKLVRKDGMFHDAAREQAQEAGYLKPDDDPNAPSTSNIEDMMDALHETLSRRRRVFSAKDASQVEDMQAERKAEGEKDREDAYREEIKDHGRAIGEIFSKSDIDAIMDLMVEHGIDAETAVSWYAESLSYRQADADTKESGDDTYTEGLRQAASGVRAGTGRQGPAIEPGRQGEVGEGRAPTPQDRSLRAEEGQPGPAVAPPKPTPPALLPENRMSLRDEARALARATGLRWPAAENWMKSEGIASVPELMVRWPDLTHTQAMERAGREIESLVLSSPTPQVQALPGLAPLGAKPAPERESRQISTESAPTPAAAPANVFYDRAQRVKKIEREDLDALRLTVAKHFDSKAQGTTGFYSLAGDGNRNLRREIMTMILGRPAKSVELTLKAMLEATVRRIGGNPESMANIEQEKFVREWIETGSTPREQFALPRDITSTPTFKAWFGDSRVVDEDGKPLVVYHGTASDIEAFTRDETDDGAFHFGNSAQANMRPRAAGKNLMPVYLAIKIPRRSRDMGTSWRRITRYAKNAGHDGIVYLNRHEGIPLFEFDAAREKGVNLDKISDEEFRKAIPSARDSYIAFRPEQIKSAFNRGTFDPNDPRISYALPSKMGFAITGEDVIAFERDLRTELDKIGPRDVGSKLVDKIRAVRSGKATPADGRYYRGLIEVSYQAVAEGRGKLTIGHESIHALKDAGLFRSAEWSTLERAAKADTKRMDRIRSHEGYRAMNLSEAELTEETIAEMFGDWYAGRSQVRGFIRTAFEKIKQIIEAIGNALKGHGFTTVEDVFGRIERGEVGRRTRGMEGGTQLELLAAARHSTGSPPKLQAGPSNAPSDEGTLNRIGPDAHFLSDITQRYTFREHGFSGLDAPTQREVLARVFAEAQDLKVRRGIVETIPVDVVNVLGGGELSAEQLFHDKAVFLDLLAAHGKDPIASGIDAASALVGAVARASAIGPLRQNITGVSADRRTASGARDSKHSNRIEQTPEGKQYTIPGAERIGDKELIERRMRGKKTATAPQKDAGGMFDLDGIKTKRGQRELFALRPERGERKSLFTHDWSAPDERIWEHFSDRNLSKFDRFRKGGRAAVDVLRQKLQDRFLPVYRVQEAIQRARGGVPIPENLDAYLAEELYYGRTGKRLDDFSRTRIEPLIKAIESEKLTQRDVEDYLYARHAPERNRQIASINPDLPGGGSGMTDAEAEGVISKFREGGKIEALKRIAAKVDKITQETMALRLTSGLMDAKTVEQWRQTYRNYVPLRGFSEISVEGTEDRRPRTGRRFDIRGEESKRAFGRESRAANILANVISMHEEAIVRSEKNAVGKTFLRLVENNPNDDLWEINRVEYKPRINRETGLVEYGPDPTYALKDNVFAVKVDGEVYHITLHHKGLAHALKNVGSETSNLMLRTLQRINRWLAFVNTSANLEFVVSNFTRDIQTAGINLQGIGSAKGLLGKIVKDVPKAMRGVFLGVRGQEQGEWIEWYHEYAKVGGKTEFFALDDITTKQKKIERMLRELNPSALIKTKQIALAVEQIIQDVNSAVENGVRLSTYVHLRKAGVSKMKAASVAKNLTVNFNRKGEWAGTTQALYLFYNASIQGSVRLIQALAHPRVQKVVAGVVIVSALLDIVNGLMSPDDDDGEKKYDKIGDYTRKHNIIVVNPFAGDDSKDAVALKVPMPYGYNVFANIGYALGRAVRSALGIGKKIDPLKEAMDLVAVALDSFNPLGSSDSILKTIIPTILKPYYELEMNKNFTGSPIMPEQKGFGPPKPDSERSFRSVSPAGKWFAQELNRLTGGSPVRPGAIDVSPETFEHWVQFVLGGAGSFVKRSGDLFYKVMAGEWKDVTWNNVPFVRRLIEGNNQWYTQRRYFELRDASELATAELKAFKKAGDSGKAAEVREKYRPEIAIEKSLDAADTQLRELRKSRDAVEVNKSLGDDAKKLRLDQIDEKMRKIMVPVIRHYNDLVKMQDR